MDATEELSPLCGQLGDASELLQGHAPVLVSLHLYVHPIHQPLPVLREMIPGPNTHSHTHAHKTLRIMVVCVIDNDNAITVRL